MKNIYTIVMNDDKSLTATCVTTLYQREKLADKIQFLFPSRYENIDIRKCTIVMKYIDQGNVAHSKILRQDHYLYKNKVRCTLPVDTNWTKFAGDIEITHISFLQINPETKLHEEVMHTGSITITIEPVRDAYGFIPDESLEFVDQLVCGLEAQMEMMRMQIQAVDDSKADNLTVEDNRLSLTSNGEKIGDEIDIVTPKINDGDVDGDYDGIVELDPIESDETGEPDDTEPDTSDPEPDDTGDNSCDCDCDCNNDSSDVQKQHFVEL